MYATRVPILMAAAILLSLTTLAAEVASTPGSAQFHNLQARASEINPDAKEYPEIAYVFADKKGKPKDVQHAVVDTRVPSRGQLVIWLMGPNQRFFEHIASYGLHVIQPHYANGWFSKIDGEMRDDGTTLGKVRLEAATAMSDLERAVGMSVERMAVATQPGYNRRITPMTTP